MKCLFSRLWAASAVAFGLAILLCLLMAHAQEIHFDNLPNPGARQTQRVTLDSGTFNVTAGHPDWIDLRFHVTPGFHINSHTPHDETLIPTSLRLNPTQSIRILKDDYPSGTPLHLDIGQGATLSTYTGDFRVRVELIANKGQFSLPGTLHYQACDTASCYPPRDLPLNVTISAR